MSRNARLRLIAGTSTLFAPALAFAQAPAPVHNMALPLVGMISGIVFVLAIITITLTISARQDRERIATIERLIDKGLPVPRELFNRVNDPPPAVRRQRDIRRGIWLLCWGVGLITVLYLIWGQWRAAIWPLVFLFLSAGSFINAYFADRTNSDSARTPDA